MTDSLKKDFHERIMLEYEKIREQNLVARSEFKKQIYSHYPRVKEIDEELSDVALKACRDILKSAYTPEQILENMKNRTEALVSEKESILAKAGLPLSCMEETFCCDLCKDTGWHDGEKCDCYKKKLQKLIRESSNINPNKMHSFDKFNLELYSEEVDTEYGISPRENAKDILQTAKRYTKLKPNSSRQLLLYGGTGLGKTFTSECIAKEFIKKDMGVFYTSAPKLFTLFEDYKFGRDTSEKTKEILDYISRVDLLIIDDLGTEFRTQYTDSILFDLINTVVNENRYMIISTNLDPTQLAGAYSDRISSRLLGNFETILFLGDDIRLTNR